MAVIIKLCLKQAQTVCCRQFQLSQSKIKVKGKGQICQLNRETTNAALGIAVAFLSVRPSVSLSLCQTRAL